MRSFLMQSVQQSRVTTMIALLLLLLATPFFFLGGPTPYSSYVFDTLWDCGHLVFFGLLVFWLKTRVDIEKKMVWLWLSLAVFVGGGIIELLQAYTGRDSSWFDVLRDVTGAWFALFWFLRGTWLVWCGRLLASVLLLPNLLTVFNAWQLQIHEANQFPLLAGFESNVELRSLRGDVAVEKQFHTQGEQSLKVHLAPVPFSGVNFNHLERDWSHYTRLRFDIYNPGNAFQMSFRVHDVLHEVNGWKDADRFNTHIQLAPGWNKFVFHLEEIQRGPRNRPMDLHLVAGMSIFVSGLPEARDIYLDNFHLE